MAPAARRCLLSPGDVVPTQPDLEVVGVFNPGAVDLDDEVLLLARVAEVPAESPPGTAGLPRWEEGAVVVDRVDEADLVHLDPRVVEYRGAVRLTFTSHLRAWRLPRDLGSTPGEPAAAWLPAGELETYGIEDPRLVQTDAGLLATYVAVSAHGAGTCLAQGAADGRKWERLGMIMPPENKDVVLFPEQIAGRWCALHRPNPRTWFGPPEMWVSFSADLARWGDHRPLADAHVPARFAATGATCGRVGGGCPPVRTADGWLVVYHGSARVPGASPDAPGVYVGLAMLLDPDDPARVLAVTPEPILQPEADFEREGFLGGVVFPTGLLDRGDDWLLVYGAADSCVGTCTIAKGALAAALVPVRDGGGGG